MKLTKTNEIKLETNKMTYAYEIFTTDINNLLGIIYAVDATEAIVLFNFLTGNDKEVFAVRCFSIYDCYGKDISQQIRKEK